MEPRARGDLPTNEFATFPPFAPRRPNNMYQSIIQIFRRCHTSVIIIRPIPRAADENVTYRSY